MLSRPSFSIRRLVSQRRPREDGEDDQVSYFYHDDEDERASLKATDKHHRSRSWISHSPPSSKKRPGPIVILRSSEDIHRISHLPPLPDTPHSSKSSLCSCEHHHNAGVASPRPAGPHSSAFCAIRSKNEHQRRPHSPALTPREGARLSPSPCRMRREDILAPPHPGEQIFDLKEALSLSPQVSPRHSPRHSPRQSPRLETGHRSKPTTPTRKSIKQSKELDTVQMLIKETDEAFMSVGVAIDQVKLEPKQFNIPSRRMSEHSLKSPTAQRPRRLSEKSIPSITTRSPPSHAASLSKAKRQRSQKARKKTRAAKKPASKWTENAKELFNVRLFNRIEADEMLSPTKLEEIRMSRMRPLRPKRSAETLSMSETTEGTDTPIDPFNLEDLPTRIGAAGVAVDIPSPIAEVPTPRSFDFNFEIVRKDFSVPKNQDAAVAVDTVAACATEEQQTTPNAKEDVEGLTYGELSFPTPPAKNPLRQVPRKQLPPLPTIPEVMVTSPENLVLTPSSDPAAEAFVFLPSRPFTRTAPTFRHGPIRLAKADVALAYSSSKLAAAAVDDTLDWTAFQMAIQGGAGDFFSEATDYGSASLPDEDAEDLCMWFGALGFDGPGRLVGEPVRGGGRRRPPPPPSPPMTEGSCSPVSSAACSDDLGGRSPGGTDLPIPVDAEHPHGFWNGAGADGGDASARRFHSAQSFGLRRWAVEGHPKRYEKSLQVAGGGGGGRRPSVDSLPQSPMLELVVSRDAEGNEYVVPMGYNLGHDLGDFLKWEAENVYAPGFYRSDEA